MEVEATDGMIVELHAATEELDEVMVVAYGTVRKSSFTGAASQVKGDDISSQQVSSISKALEGVTAGVQVSNSDGSPGTNASILVRGIGSISATQSPLIVVDGVPYEGSLNSISAQDIESLTVLKDAAANSMYGARGSNGVIVITTKSAQPGDIKVQLDARVGFNSRGIPSYNIINDPGDYYEMMYEAIVNNLVESGTYSNLTARQYVANNLISGYLKYNIYAGIADNELIDPLTGKINPNATTRKWTDNWSKDPFNNGLRQEYNVSLTGGTENTKGYASISYLSDDGYVTNSGFDRISARAKVDQNIGKYIKTGVNIAYANTERQAFGNTDANYSNLFMFSQSIGPIYPIYLYDTNGNLMYDAEGNALYDFGTTYQRPYAQEQNPYAVLLANQNKYITDNLSTRAYVDVMFLKDFKFTANVAYDVFNQNDVEYMTHIGGDAASVNGRGYRQSVRYNALNANQLLNWTPKYGNHSINLLLGHETKKDRSSLLYGHMTNFMDPDNSEFANASSYQDLTSYSSTYALEGYFGRVEYDFADKYYVSASYRADASSRFAPENRWGQFWSVGASWRMKEEAFLQNVDAISNMKLKASYGTQGNDNIGYSQVYLDLYAISRVDGEAGLTKVFRGNPDLTWEKSNNFNAGIELGLFDRVNISSDFFIKETKDMIYARPLAASEGSPSTIIVNDLDMKNTGIEFEVSADVIKNRNIRWNISFNGTHYKNQMTRLPEDKAEAIATDGGYQRGNYWMKIGGSLYDWYLYEYEGVDPENGLPRYNKYTPILDENGVETGEYKKEYVHTTSEATLRETGKSAIPDFYGGLSTTLEAYGVDVNISTAFQIGGYVYDSFYQSLMNAGNAGENMHTDMFNRWTPTNTDTDVPRLCYNDQEANGMSDRWLTSASYFSLRNVTIGYTLPSKLTKKAKIEKARFYLTGDNIWLKSARKGLDPRQDFTGATGYIYSALSTYSIGVNLTF